jgi:arsenite methyltransferase
MRPNRGRNPGPNGSANRMRAGCERLSSSRREGYTRSCSPCNNRRVSPFTTRLTSLAHAPRTASIKPLEAARRPKSERSTRLLEAVREAYSAAAAAPQAEHPFPVGRKFAESLCYPANDLAALPPISVEAFTGVANVSVFADLQPGMRVLDLGCGSGLDALIAARRVGNAGKVVGMDFSAAMLKRAHRAAIEAGASNLAFCQACAESLPLASESIDVALVNGIFNLNPLRDEIFHELARVVRPGGSAYAAELILRAPLPAEVRASEQDWFA